MSREGKIVFCEICGNEVEFVVDSNMPIICCGQEMQLKESSKE